MRCPDCNKFVGYGDPELETQRIELNGTMLEVEVEMRLTCSDCGMALKSATITAESEVEHDCADVAELSEEVRAQLKPDPDYDGDEPFEFDECTEFDTTDRQQTTDRNGKPIRNSRYRKTFYGFEGTVDCTCKKCGMLVSVSLSGEEQASSFEECC